MFNRPPGRFMPNLAYAGFSHDILGSGYVYGQYTASVVPWPSTVANYDNLWFVQYLYCLYQSIFNWPRFSIFAASLTADAAGPFLEPCYQSIRGKRESLAALGESGSSDRATALASGLFVSGYIFGQNIFERKLSWRY
jgi:hypothetical protein